MNNMSIQEIVAAIKNKQPEIKTVYFVGCGASMSDLFPAKYFRRTMQRNCVPASIQQTTSITQLQQLLTIPL